MTRQENAARAAIIALRSTLPNPEEAGLEAYMFLPERVPVDREAAITALIGMPKPVSCIAAAAGGAMAIACWPLDARRAARLHGQQLASRLQSLERLAQSSGQLGGRWALLLEGHDESMVLDNEDLREWWTSYFLPLGAFTISRDSVVIRRDALRVLRYFPLERSDSGGVSQTRGEAGRE